MRKPKITLTLTFLLLNFGVYAQSKATFETGIKIQKTEFLPYDYTRTLTDSEPYWTSSVSKLRNNEKTINPFFFNYKDVQRGFGFEFEHSRIQIEKANFDNDIISGNNVRRFKNYLTNNERNDYKLNFIFYPNQKWQDLLAFGLGIRKIDRLRNRSESDFSYEEKILALGPQILFRSKIPISEQFSLNLGLDIYHSQGRREYNYSSTYHSSFDNFSYIQIHKDNGKTLGIYQGFEANISLKYNFLENYNIDFGYNYNYAYFKYENLDDRIYYYTSQFRDIGFGYDNVKVSNGKELLRGFYFSASTIF